MRARQETGRSAAWQGWFPQDGGGRLRGEEHDFPVVTPGQGFPTMGAGGEWRAEIGGQGIVLSLGTAAWQDETGFFGVHDRASFRDGDCMGIILETGRATGRSFIFSRSMALPRQRRDITVPSGISRIVTVS